MCVWVKKIGCLSNLSKCAKSTCYRSFPSHACRNRHAVTRIFFYFLLLFCMSGMKIRDRASRKRISQRGNTTERSFVLSSRYILTGKQRTTGIFFLLIKQDCHADKTGTRLDETETLHVCLTTPTELKCLFVCLFVLSICCNKPVGSASIKCGCELKQEQGSDLGVNTGVYFCLIMTKRHYLKKKNH